MREVSKQKSRHEAGFFCSFAELLGGSGSRSGSSVSGGSSGSVSGRSSGSVSGGSSSVSGGSSGSSGFRSGSSGFFFLATGGQTESQQGGEQDGVFHLVFP